MFSKWYQQLLRSIHIMCARVKKRSLYWGWSSHLSIGNPYKGYINSLLLDWRLSSHLEGSSPRRGSSNGSFNAELYNWAFDAVKTPRFGSYLYKKHNTPIVHDDYDDEVDADEVDADDDDDDHHHHHQRLVQLFTNLDFMECHNYFEHLSLICNFWLDMMCCMRLKQLHTQRRRCCRWWG